MKRVTVKEMMMCAMFTVLIVVGAFIKIPIPVVPFTLQFLFTLLAGLLLGPKLGTISVLLYAVLGLIGVPVFAEGGGIWYLLKPSFGYIIGFVLGTYATGKVLENAKIFDWRRVLFANFLNLFIVYAVGMFYYYVICNYVINTPIAVWPLFLYCFILAVPGDICLCFLAAILYKRIQPVLKREHLI